MPNGGKQPYIREDTNTNTLNRHQQMNKHNILAPQVAIVRWPKKVMLKLYQITDWYDVSSTPKHLPLGSEVGCEGR